ncbi:alcohol dehydrogenase [Hypoxylon crocopeplum]|nr:alcohol dehydrogenase [Hypoxylon crocopeplum]
MRAIVAIKKGLAAIQEVTKPKLRDGCVLVKVKAVGLNPADWKNLDKRAVPGIRLGLDYVGIVEEIGNGVMKPFKKGDRIAGWANGGDEYQPDTGAFGDYAIVKAHVQFKVPENITDEQAATFGVSMSTVAQGLYKALGLPWPNAPAKTPFPILIYGGSTATGIYGIQFAKASGLTVVTTASPRNFEYLKSLGADAVFDYNSPTCAEDIKALTGNKLALVWDCTGDGGEIGAKALTDAADSKYATIMPVDADLVHAINPRVDGPLAHVAYDVHGDPYMWPDGGKPARPEEAAYAARFLELCPGLLESGAVKPVRTIVNFGGSGLEGVMKGLDELRAGRVSGAKFVYTLP